MSAPRRWRCAVALGCALAGLGLAGGVLGNASASRGDPTPWAPPGARVFDWAGSTQLQGVPLVLQGFVSVDPPDAVAAAARRHRPGAVESRHGAARVLGWFDAGHHTTLRIDPAGGGSRGVWSAVPLGAALQASRRALDAPAWAPPGSRPGLALATRAADRASQVSVAFNQVTAQANAEHVIAHLTAEGLRLEGRSPIGGPAARGGPDGDVSEAMVLHFTAPGGRRSVVAIVRQGDGDTVLTRIEDGPGRAAP